MNKKIINILRKMLNDWFYEMEPSLWNKPQKFLTANKRCAHFIVCSRRFEVSRYGNVEEHHFLQGMY